MDAQISSEIIKLLLDCYGYPEIPLQYSNLYQLTIAVILSAQTTDEQVNRITPDLFAKYPDFRRLAKAERSDVERIIHSTGFYRNKASNIISLAAKVSGDLDGRLPENIEDLITLPGIGRKSANVIISQGFGKPGLAVDTHVLRIANRLGYCDTKNPDIAEREMKKIIPPDDWSVSHLLFITHGRKTCKARNPKCAECVIQNLCPCKDKRL